MSTRSLNDLDMPISAGEQNQDETLSNLVALMRHPNSGLDIKDRRKTLISRKTQRRCFVAKELVDWILRNIEISSYERSCATELAQQLFSRGFLKPVSGNARSFEDGNTLYRFSEDQNLVNIRKASILQKKHKPIHNSDEKMQKNQNIRKYSSPSLQPREGKKSTQPIETTKQSLTTSSNSTGAPSSPNSPSSKLHHSMEYKINYGSSFENSSLSNQPSSSPKFKHIDSSDTHGSLNSIDSLGCIQYFQNFGINTTKIQVEDKNKKSDRYQWVVSYFLLNVSFLEIILFI